MLLIARLARGEEVVERFSRRLLVEVADEVDDQAVLLHAGAVSESGHVVQDGKAFVELI